MQRFKSITQKVVARMPAVARMAIFPIPKSARHKGLGLCLNQAFKMPLQNGDLEFLNAKRVGINVPDIELAFSVAIDQQRLTISAPSDKDDVVVRADSDKLLLLMMAKVDPDTLFFKRQLSVTGDTELGLTLKNFLDTLDPQSLLPGPLYQFTNALADQIPTANSNQLNSQLRH